MTGQEYHDMEKVVENFNFVEVQKQYQQNNWVWADTLAGPNKVPSVLELESHARYCLTKVLNNSMPYSNAGSGRICAYKFPWGLKLVFEPFSSSSF